MENFLDEKIAKQYMPGILRRYRDAAGLSQQDLVDIVGISKGFYSSLEMGRRVPNLDMLIKIAKACRRNAGCGSGSSGKKHALSEPIGKKTLRVSELLIHLSSARPFGILDIQAILHGCPTGGEVRVHFVISSPCCSSSPDDATFGSHSLTYPGLSCIHFSSRMTAL